MYKYNIRKLIKIVSLFVALLIVNGITHGQSIDSKLAKQVDFIPQNSSVLEQLTEIAQHYQIPMGIEWIEVPKVEKSQIEKRENMTVENLIKSVLSQSQGYKMKKKNGLVHIYPSFYVKDEKNILNLRLAHYQIDNANLYDASLRLRLETLKKLNPERYKGGWNGGYGYGTPRSDGFDISNITLSIRNSTVREILNNLIKLNGNALWIMRFESLGDVNEATLPKWAFIPIKTDIYKEKGTYSQ